MAEVLMAKRKGWSWAVTLALVMFGFLALAGYLLMVEGLTKTDRTPDNLITDSLRTAHLEYPDLFVLLWGLAWGSGGLAIGGVSAHVFHRWGRREPAISLVASEDHEVDRFQETLDQQTAPDSRVLLQKVLNEMSVEPGALTPELRAEIRRAVR